MEPIVVHRTLTEHLEELCSFQDRRGSIAEFDGSVEEYHAGVARFPVYGQHAHTHARARARTAVLSVQRFNGTTCVYTRGPCVLPCDIYLFILLRPADSQECGAFSSPPHAHSCN